MPALEEVRQRHVELLDRALDSIVDQLRALEDVRQVILFGSWARGRRDLCSDLDLIVVMDSRLDFVSRCVELAGRLRTGAPIDLFHTLRTRSNAWASDPSCAVPWRKGG